MRVVVNYATGAVASCNTNITGETEDYLFAVTAASCVVPSAEDIDEDGNDPDHPNGLPVRTAEVS